MQFIYFLAIVAGLLVIYETANKFFEPVIWPQFKRFCDFCREQSAR